MVFSKNCYSSMNLVFSTFFVFFITKENLCFIVLKTVIVL